MEYKCKKCGGKEFISKPNRYDVFKVQGNKIFYRKTEIIDEKSILFCRECSEKIKFCEEDIII